MNNASTPGRGITFSPLVIALIVGIAGYGLGRFQGNMSTEEVEQKLEESRSQAKVSAESVVNVEKRVSISEAYRHTLQALVAAQNRNTTEVQYHLRQANELLTHSGGASELDKLSSESLRLSNLAESRSVTPELESLCAQFERLIPKPVGALGAVEMPSAPK